MNVPIKSLGTVFLLLAFLLFIAFTSYLFTWDEDQDKFSYGMLLANDIKVQNLLGHLWRIYFRNFYPSWFWNCLLSYLHFLLCCRRKSVFWEKGFFYSPQYKIPDCWFATC